MSRLRRLRAPLHVALCPVSGASPATTTAHDQEQALAIADRVGVMRAGRLEQMDTPTTIDANAVLVTRPES